MPPANRRRRTTKRKGPDTSTWTDEDRKQHELHEKLRTPIAELALPVRVVNTLEDSNIILVSDLLRQSYDALMQMNNFGDKTLREVKEALLALGVPMPAWNKPPAPKKTRTKKRDIFNMWG